MLTRRWEHFAHDADIGVRGIGGQGGHRADCLGPEHDGIHINIYPKSHFPCGVRVKCEGKDAALGTIVAADGWILTKHRHLTGTPVCQLKDGREFEASVVSVDERFDLALLRIEATGLKPVEWRPSTEAPLGSWVAAAGIGPEPVAIGVVSVPARDVPDKPGPGGYLGIRLAVDDGWPRISQVMPGSGADKAGLKANDLVLAVNGEEVRDAEAVIAALQRHKPGAVVHLLIKRDDKELKVKATLGKPPATLSRGEYQNSLGSELSDRRYGFPTILHHDAVIKPTDCGGPLVDLDGKAIGINIARVGRTESDAVPAEVVQPLVARMMTEKKVPAPRRMPG